MTMKSRPRTEACRSRACSVGTVIPSSRASIFASQKSAARHQLNRARLRDAALSQTAVGYTSRLVVLPTDVVNAADRRPVTERAVGPSPVVVAKEGCQGPIARG